MELVGKDLFTRNTIMEAALCTFCSRWNPIKALGALVNKPLIDFKRATEKLSDHFASLC